MLQRHSRLHDGDNDISLGLLVARPGVMENTFAAIFVVMRLVGRVFRRRTASDGRHGDGVSRCCGGRRSKHD